MEGPTWHPVPVLLRAGRIRGRGLPKGRGTPSGGFPSLPRRWAALVACAAVVLAAVHAVCVDGRAPKRTRLPDLPPLEKSSKGGGSPWRRRPDALPAKSAPCSVNLSSRGPAGASFSGAPRAPRPAPRAARPASSLALFPGGWMGWGGAVQKNDVCSYYTLLVPPSFFCTAYCACFFTPPSFSALLLFFPGPVSLYMRVFFRRFRLCT